MDETAYNFEFAMWYDIERNKKHLKKDGEHYVADAMLLRENISLRQENDSLKKENAILREIASRLYLFVSHADNGCAMSLEEYEEIEAMANCSGIE